MKVVALVRSLLFASVCLVCVTGPARAAETREVRVSQGFGVAFLPLMIMEHNKLIEKHAKLAGLGDLAVSWPKLAGPTAANDGIISGSLDFAAVGVPALAVLWSRTRDTADVRGVAAMVSLPMYLNTRNPGVKSIRDLTEKDRIAMTAVKVSVAAIYLQMAAERMFGPKERFKFDPLTVSMSHPDGMTALLSGGGEITAHFTSPPFHYMELERPGIRTILSSDDILGGATTFSLPISSGRFRNANPKTYAAFVAALREAIEISVNDRKAAAEIYLKMSGDKRSSVEDIVKMLSRPEIRYTMTPENVQKMAEFMANIGTIKIKSASWRDLFFPEVHQLPGS